MTLRSPEHPIPAPPARTIPGAPAELEPGVRGVPTKPAPTKKRRWPYVVGGVAIVLGVALAIAWGPIVRSLTIREAEAHGVILDELGDVSLGWGTVTLHDFQFRLEGVEGVQGKGKELVVDLDGMKAEALAAEEVDIELVGSAAVLAVDIGEFAGRHPDLTRIPSDVEDVNVTWRESADGPVWLKIRGGDIEPLKKGARLSAQSTEVLGFSVGRAGAIWSGDEAKVSLGFGADAEEDAPVHIEVENLKKEPKATITLRPTPLLQLSGPLGMLLPIKGVTASGDAVLRYAGKKKAPIVGHVNAKLDGFTPPLPREAQGFVFGDTTTLSTDVELSADRSKITLSDIKVTHGGFKVTGGGTIVREKSRSAIDISLTGRISCAALAKAALKGGLGPRLGPLVDGLASGAVQGSVEVKLHIQADTGNLLGAKIERSLGVGCGIRWPSLPSGPLPQIPGLPELPIPPL